MKIAFVNDTFLRSRGADVVIYELARRIGKEHEVFVITGKSDIKEENFKIINLELDKLYEGNLKDITYFSKMRKLEKQVLELQNKHNFDIFNIYHLGLNPAFKKLPSILVWNGSPPTKNLLRKMLMNYLMKTTKYNKKIITISNFLKDQLSFLGDKAVLIYDGVSSEFKPIEKDENYMLYAGRLVEHKNVQDMIKLSKDLEYKLKIVGEGPEEERLKALAEKLNADVEFLGNISRKELIKAYQECSFFVSGSQWEGFGLIFIEAGACSKPSIGYNKGSIPEVILNETTGFVVENYEEFLEKAKILKYNLDVREKMGKEALKYSKKFNWDDIAKKHIEVFENETN